MRKILLAALLGMMAEASPSQLKIHLEAASGHSALHPTALWVCVTTLGKIDCPYAEARGVLMPNEGNASIDLTATIAKEWGKQGEEKVYLYIRHNSSTGIWKGTGFGIGDGEIVKDMSICDSTLPCISVVVHAHVSTPPTIVFPAAVGVIGLIAVILGVVLNCAWFAIALTRDEPTDNVIAPTA